MQDPHRATRDSWDNMISRCTNPNAASKWDKYGGQGITVCDRWLVRAGGSFENFLADMGERPKGMTLDRWPDPRGNYEPGNCCWSTPSVQRQHSGPCKNGSSKFKGVSLYKARNKWEAAIKIDSTHAFLGRFAVEEDAARAYDATALEAWGEDCWLNFKHRQEAVPMCTTTSAGLNND
jgi:hypothetical protein